MWKKEFFPYIHFSFYEQRQHLPVAGMYEDKEAKGHSGIGWYVMGWGEESVKIEF